MAMPPPSGAARSKYSRPFRVLAIPRRCDSAVDQVELVAIAHETDAKAGDARVVAFGSARLCCIQEADIACSYDGSALLARLHDKRGILVHAQPDRQCFLHPDQRQSQPSKPQTLAKVLVDQIVAQEVQPARKANFFAHISCEKRAGCMACPDGGEVRGVGTLIAQQKACDAPLLYGVSQYRPFANAHPRPIQRRLKGWSRGTTLPRKNAMTTAQPYVLSG